MFLQLSLFIYYLAVIRICFFVFLKVVKNDAHRFLALCLIVFGIPAFLYFYHINYSIYPLIHFNGSTGYGSILLTFWTYFFN